jgi:tRNA threonylcarbamoyladenosine biosynthesis protein TsaE
VTDVVVTRSQAETEAVGRAFAESLAPGVVVLLSGDLGAGKTAFVRGMAAGLSIDPTEVSSPTFTLVQEYRGGRLVLRHVDLYRLAPHEVDDLGLEEMALEPGVLALEWPDRLPRPIGDAVNVTIDHGTDDRRTITIDRG